MRNALMQTVEAMYSGDGSLPSLGGTLYLERAPDGLGPGTTFTVLTIRDEAESDTLGNDGSRVRFVFNIYTPRPDGPQASSDAARRLRTVFHHEQLTAISGYAFTKARRVSGINVPEADTYYHAAEEYEVEVFAA